MTLAIISHPDCALHDAGEGHPEQPARLQVIQQALEKYAFNVPVQFFEAPQATREQLKYVHDEDFISWIHTIAPQTGTYGIDADTWMNPHTLNAALRAAGAVMYAVDLVMQDKAQAVFCNIRPPGHHAESDKAMGFCFFNNVALGAAYALEKFHLKRVAIIDFDVHHGNGTQEIFQEDTRVLYCSSFEHPQFPGYDGKLDNDHIISIPLPSGTTSAEFRNQVEAKWFDKIAAFKPQLIFFSAGFDGHIDDPLANLNLEKEDYVWLTQQIAAIAKVCCEGRLISVLEGGYDLRVLAESVPAHVNAMIN